jgi:hypothetical protein
MGTDDISTTCSVVLEDLGALRDAFIAEIQPVMTSHD